MISLIIFIFIFIIFTIVGIIGEETENADKTIKASIFTILKLAFISTMISLIDIYLMSIIK